MVSCPSSCRSLYSSIASHGSQGSPLGRQVNSKTKTVQGVANYPYPWFWCWATSRSERKEEETNNALPPDFTSSRKGELHLSPQGFVSFILSIYIYIHGTHLRMWCKCFRIILLTRVHVQQSQYVFCIHCISHVCLDFACNGVHIAKCVPAYCSRVKQISQFHLKSHDCSVRKENATCTFTGLPRKLKLLSTQYACRDIVL